MYRLSLIISEIYNKYLPLAEKEGIVLNLDFSDTTKEIPDSDRVKKFLDEQLESTLKNSDHGEVTISVDKEAITVTDTATTLSPSACALLSNRYIDVKSRVGFGTTVRIFFSPREVAHSLPESKQVELEGISFTIDADNSSHQPTLESTVRLKAGEKRTKHKFNFGAGLQLKGKDRTAKVQQSSIRKPTTKKLTAPTKKTATQVKRELAAAAKKTDKEVKRIIKKAKKQNKQLAKTTNQKLADSTTKTQKTIRKLKLS